MNVVIIGSSDRQLADTLRSSTVKVSALDSLHALLAAPATDEAVDLVVVDIRGRASVPAELSSLRRMHPNMGIIVVAERLDPVMMQEAIRAGVNEFLAEPLFATDVRSAFDRVSGLQSAQERGKLYAFVGGKGGVGTTTLAVNVATALAKSRSGRVLFVDLHPAHGDAALFFGAEPRFSLFDALDNTHRLDDAFLRGLVTHTKTGVDLLASPDRATAAALDPQRVRTTLGLVSGLYGHVVVDVPRSDAAALDGLDSAATIVVVANQELATVRGASRIASALRARYGSQRVRVVVSRYETQGVIGQEDIERVTGGKIQTVFPSDYRLAVDALNRGCPLVVQNHSHLAGSFAAFALSLAGLQQPPAEPAKPAGLLGLLKGKR